MARRFPAAWLDQLRSQADIVQVVSGYVPLKKNGQKYWGLCPFHNEKTASFSVDTQRQMFYCFGCKASGSAIQFVMDIERLSYYDAVVHLADQYHLPLPEMVEDPDGQRRRTPRDRLLAANLEAARYYHELLFQPAGEAALAYLKRRGLSDSVIRRFGLGASSDRWDDLSRHLLGQGYTEEELRLAGLTVVRPAEEATGDRPARPRRVFDMFRNRAMFPIIDQYGHVLAFGGRSLGNEQPKDLNTSDTPIFNKRQGVYAANLLRKERHLERVILVEGYMDVVALNQFGVAGVCATLGTALTAEQAQLLRRFAPKVYLAYDGDSAGQHAIMRGLDILQEANVPARVLDFPDGLDPDEFIRRDGAEAFAKLPVLSPEAYRMRRLREQHDLSTQEGRTEYAKACAPILRQLEPVELENALSELSVQTGFAREVLLAQLEITPAPQRQAAATTFRPARPRTQALQLSEGMKAQETLISLLASGRLPKDIVSEQDFDDPLLKMLYSDLSSGLSPAAILEAQEDETQRQRTAQLLLPLELEDTDQMISMARECLDQIRAQQLGQELDALKQSLPTAAEADRPGILQRIQELTAQRKKLKSHHEPV